MFSFQPQVTPVKNQVSVYASTPNVLDCDNFRTFWVGWLNGTISVGQGWRYGQGLLTSQLETKQHPVEAVSISSQDSSKEVTWMFQSDKGNFYLSPSDCHISMAINI